MNATSARYGPSNLTRNRPTLLAVINDTTSSSLSGTTHDISKISLQGYQPHSRPHVISPPPPPQHASDSTNAHDSFKRAVYRQHTYSAVIRTWAVSTPPNICCAVVDRTYLPDRLLSQHAQHNAPQRTADDTTVPLLIERRLERPCKTRKLLQQNSSYQ